jgi:D-alanyl-D-alanine carboxypeptidase
MNMAIELYIVLLLLLGAPLDTLVTKDVGLPPWYAPGESAIAEMALEEMTHAAELDGILIWVNSAYRDYSYQEDVLSREGNLSPDDHRSYSAEPGHSEHQLGTTYDVAWPGLRVDSLNPRNLKLFQWLTQNAHLYGFVISYPYKEIPDWPYHNRWLPLVTEYIHEPWHIRYVGEVLALEMLEAGYLIPGTPILPQDFYTPWP